MYVILSFLLLWPGLCFAQLKVASALPISGDSFVESQGAKSKLESNHWIKAGDEISSTTESRFEVSFKNSTLVKSQEDSRLKLISENELLILKGCFDIRLAAQMKLRDGDVFITSGKKNQVYLCSNNRGLSVVSINGEIEFKKDNDTLQVIRSGEFSILNKETGRISQQEKLNPIQFYKIQGMPVPQGLSELEKLVPYGLTSSMAENKNEVLIEEIRLLGREASKLKFEQIATGTKGGAYIDFEKSESIPASASDYYDPFLEIAFFTPKLNESKAPITRPKRIYFYRPSLEEERVTGGVRGIFDPQRFEVIK